MQSLVGPKKWLTDSLLGCLLLCIITVSFDPTSEHKVKLILFHLRLENPPTMNPIIVGAPFWCESDRWNKTNLVTPRNRNHADDWRAKQLYFDINKRGRPWSTCHRSNSASLLCSYKVHKLEHENLLLTRQNPFPISLSSYYLISDTYYKIDP